MGRRITIDSATLMNKGFEVIEACWLFGLSADEVDVVVHPQSSVHAMVEYTDGSVIAQISATDMRMPIQYALTYPARDPAPVPRIDWTETRSWTFLGARPEEIPGLAAGVSGFPGRRIGWLHAECRRRNRSGSLSRRSRFPSRPSPRWWRRRSIACQCARRRPFRRYWT